MQKMRWATGAVGVLSVLLLVYVSGKYVIPILAPILLAGTLVLLVYPWGKRLSGWTALRPGICCLVLLLALLLLLGGAAYLGGYYLWREASAFYAWLYENADSLVGAISGLFATQGQGISLPPFLQKLLHLLAKLLVLLFYYLLNLLQHLVHILLLFLNIYLQ